MSDTTHSATDLAAKTYHALQAWLDHMRARPRTPTQFVNLALWLVYLGCYPIAVIGVAFDVRPGFSMAWAGSVLLFMQGALAVLWLATRLGWRRGGLFALLIALGGYAGETLGVATGFPFGPYSYAAILFPQLPGTVPLPVIGAWLVVVTSAVAIARWLIPVGIASRRWRQIALATMLGVGLDLVLEPVAVRLQHYWIWHASGPYYNIPLSNFIGWAALCTLLSGMIIALWPETISPSLLQMMRRSGDEASIPMLALYVLTAAMFGMVNLTHGLLIAALIGSVLVVALALCWRATYHIAEGTRTMP